MFPSPSILSSLTPGKNTAVATKCRNDGNANYKQGKFFEALELYNASLMVAKINSIEIPLAYANRSAVYLEVKEFQLCLDNIQLAIDSGYPVKKMKTLKDREQKCKKMMQSEVKTNDDDDPWKFFKLSYPVNEKIPFIAGCLELRQNKKFGRYIITNRDLKPGDIIGIEEPLFHMIRVESENLRCNNCLKSNKMSLIPSDVLDTAMFCSKTCIDEAETYLKAEKKHGRGGLPQRVLFKSLAICGGSFEKLQQLIDDPELSNKTVFDFDHSNHNDPLFKFHQLVAANSLSMEIIKSGNEEAHFKSIAMQLFHNKTEVETARYFMSRFYKITQNSSYGIEWKFSSRGVIAPKGIGFGTFLFGALLNHSCIPNIDALIVDNKCVYIVNTPIFKGEQLFISYGPIFHTNPFEARQREIKLFMDFDCKCAACVHRYPTLNILLFMKFPIADMKKEYKKNCIIIAHNLYKSLKLKIIKLVFKNWHLLMAISKNEPLIFLK